MNIVFGTNYRVVDVLDNLPAIGEIFITPTGEKYKRADYSRWLKHNGEVWIEVILPSITKLKSIENSIVISKEELGEFAKFIDNKCVRDGQDEWDVYSNGRPKRMASSALFTEYINTILKP